MMDESKTPSRPRDIPPAFDRSGKRHGGGYVLGTLTRTLVLLLILRVAASPLALRPSSPRPHSNYHVVVRVCSWPAPRPERSPSTSSLLRVSLGNGPGTIAEARAWAPPASLRPVPRLFAPPTSCPASLRC